MKVQDVANGAQSPDVIIQQLKQRSFDGPDIEKLRNQINVKGHEVYDKIKRPDRIIYPDGKFDDKGNPLSSKIEYVNRIGLAIQKIIVSRAISFLFGNPVVLKYTAKTSQDKLLVEALKRFLHDNKEYTLNRRAARSVFNYTEVAEYWFTVEAKESFNKYGFSTKRKMRCVLFTPENGDKLYPKFDATGDLIAFSREFEIKEGTLTTTYFETYTDEEIVRWKKSSLTNGWLEYIREDVTIGKMPIVYGRQPQTEYEDVNDLISRIEKAFSNLAETNDYHAAPKIFVTGKILSFGTKGQSNTILEGAPNSEAKYLSWDHAPESFKIEVENLLKMIYSLTQTPDISFESVKGIGVVSGVALKLLFMDAHLKVKDKEEIFIEYLQRRYSILKAYAGEMHNPLQKVDLELEPEIDPFMIADEKEQAEVLTTLNGGKPVISQKRALQIYGIDDIEEEIKQLIEEEKRANSFSAFEPTV